MNKEELEKDLGDLVAKREYLLNQVKDINAVIIYLSTKQKQNLEKNKKKEVKIPNEAKLMETYNLETGKKAIWRGNHTKGYLKWIEEKAHEIIQNKNRLR